MSNNGYTLIGISRSYYNLKTGAKEIKLFPINKHSNCFIWNSAKKKVFSLFR